LDYKEDDDFRPMAKPSYLTKTELFGAGPTRF
jgi:hypothetical protein